MLLIYWKYSVVICFHFSIFEPVRGNLAVSNFRKMSLPTYEIQSKDYGYRKFNKKIHTMEQK